MERPKDLWNALLACEARALESGALQPIAAQMEVVEDEGVRFQLRISATGARKAQARPGAPANPFLPYDARLYVADASATHVYLLNKYMVLPHHLLVVTRAFEHQETLLARADFEALWLALSQYDGLGFYNGGRDAGASQMHKHLQIVPLPLAPAEPAVPLSTWWESGRTLPFAHALAALDCDGFAPHEAAAHTHAAYHDALAALGIGEIERDGERRQSAPYNLLVTRRWLLLVPRTRECYRGVAVNALGYAGSFFVRSDAERDMMREHGPFSALRAVGMAT